MEPHMPIEIVESVPVHAEELGAARGGAMGACDSAAEDERMQLQGAGTQVVALPSSGAAAFAKSSSQNDTEKEDGQGARGYLPRSSGDGETRCRVEEAEPDTAGVRSGPRGGGLSQDPATANGTRGPTHDSPRRKRKKDTRRGSEWLKPRRAKSSRWTKRKKPRAKAWPVGPEPMADLRCHEHTRQDETSLESDDEQLRAAAATAAASSAIPAPDCRKRRKVVQQTSSLAEPADEEELEFGSPLLPNTVRADVAIETPHPLRCGQLYDNIRRLHFHATADLQQADPARCGVSSHEGEPSECDGDGYGGRDFEGQVLVHHIRKYTCRDRDTVAKVCSKLKKPVHEVFEINRRRLVDVPNFRISAKLRKGHVLLIPDEKAELKTTVQRWEGWHKDGENWIEYWSGKDEQGQRHDLEAEDIYTGVGFDVRGDTPGHQMIGQRIRGTSGFLIVAHQPATDHGPSEGPDLWKVHYETQQGEPTGVREDLELHELEEKYRANGVRLSICDVQPPPGQRTQGAVVTERSREDSERQHKTLTIEARAVEAPGEEHAAPQLDDESNSRSSSDSEHLVDHSADVGAGTSSVVLSADQRANDPNEEQRVSDWKNVWIDKWRLASFPAGQRRTSWRRTSMTAYQDPDARATLWKNVSTRSFIVLGKLRELGRRGGLPQRSHVNLQAAAGRCKCGCRAQQLDLKEKAVQDVNMSKLIDIELHKQRFCGEVCSISRSIGGKAHVRPRLQTSCQRRVDEFVQPPRCGGGRNGPEKCQLNRRKGSGVNPAFVSAVEASTGHGAQYEERLKADLKTPVSYSQEGVLRRRQQEIDETHVAGAVHTLSAGDDYDPQGCGLDDADTRVDELAAQRIDESGQSDRERGGGALESGAGSAPSHIDLVTNTKHGDTDDEEQARRTYSQRRRVRTDAYNPCLEACKPQWSPVAKKRTALESVCGDDNMASVDSAAISCINDVELPSGSSSASSDSMDESDHEPPDYVMLELFCGTCTVSQRAKVYWENQGCTVKRITLDYNEKLTPQLDGSSDHHLIDDVLSSRLDNPRKWVKSLLVFIRKVWGARAISFVWASPDCSQYSTANTATTFHEKGRGLLQANRLVTRTREIINELQCHAAKLHVPFHYIIENPSSGRLPEQDVIRDLPFLDVSYCHYGHPARKDTRLWFCATPGFADRLKPRKCAKDSAVGECCHKRQHKTHQCNATGGKGSQRGLQGPSRHRVPPKLVDEVLAALFLKKPSLEQLLEPLRRDYSDEEIRRALASQDSPSLATATATATVCAANEETGGAEASDASNGATFRTDGTFVI